MNEQEKIEVAKAIEIRSEEINEILGRKPQGLIRWGISVIFIVICILLVGSYFYKYPDIIITPATITTENMPVNLVAKTNGKLSGLLVQDNEEVQQGEILAIIENPAQFEDVQLLKLKLDTLAYCFNTSRIQGNKSIDTVNFEDYYLLGDIQTYYISFLKSLNDFNFFISSDFQHKKIKAIQKEIQHYNVLQQKVITQKNISSQQLDLSNKQFSRDSSLYQNNAISKSEFEKSKNVLLQEKYSYENAKSSIDNVKITISQLEQSILELEQQWNEQDKQLFNLLSNNFASLQNQIKTWEQTFLLTTPVSGKITFTKFWSINQDIKAGDNVLTIVPKDPEKIIGKIQMPLVGSGKVKIGQKVNIKLDNYPYMEYGVLIGSIRSISLVPNENNYYAEVNLPDGLITNYNKTLPFAHQLQGQAEIITDDISLLERFLQPLHKILKTDVR